MTKFQTSIRTAFVFSMLAVSGVALAAAVPVNAVAAARDNSGDTHRHDSKHDGRHDNGHDRNGDKDKGGADKDRSDHNNWDVDFVG